MFDQLLLSFIKNPQKTNFDGEDQDETVEYVIRRAWLTNWLWISLTILFIFVPYVIAAFFPLTSFIQRILEPQHLFVLNILWYLFIFAFFFQNFFNWFFNIYIITDKRIIDMDFIGLLYKNISETPLTKIEDVTSNVSGAFELIFNIGDVRIQTAGEKTEFEFHDVSHPSRIRDILSDKITDIAANG